MKKYIGVDLGGTNVRAAVVDEEGHVSRIGKTASHPENGPESLVKTISDLVQSLPDWQEARAVGIGLPGILNREMDTVVMANNLPLLEGYPLAKSLSEALGRPVILGNDGKTAALAEALQGAGKGEDVVYYVTLSTGVGGALVADGKVHMGHSGYAGEICNLIVDKNRPARNRLNPGALENEASGTAIAYYGKEELGPEVNSAADVFRLADQNDPEACRIVDTLCENLAIGLTNIALVTDPGMFVLGGGMMNAEDSFLEKTTEKYRELVFPGMRNVKFARAQLEEPGIIGAAMLPASLGY